GERSAPGERGELHGEGLEVLRQGRGYDDEVRVPGVDRPGQLLARGVHPEIVDPPPAAVQDDAEDHQRQVVKLAGGAGQDSAGAVPVPPAPGQPGEPPADEVAGEVLLGDAGRAPLPALPELGQIRQHHVPEHRRHGQVGHEPVQDRLRGRLVEGVQGLPEGAGQLTRRRRGAVRPGGPAGVRPCPTVLPEHRPRRLGGRQPAGQVGLHPADPQRVRLGVQPEAARRAHRLQQAVAALPRPQHVVAHAGAPAELADAQHRRAVGSVHRAAWSVHASTLQRLNRHLTISRRESYRLWTNLRRKLTSWTPAPAARRPGPAPPPASPARTHGGRRGSRRHPAHLNMPQYQMRAKLTCCPRWVPAWLPGTSTHWSRPTGCSGPACWPMLAVMSARARLRTWSSGSSPTSGRVPTGTTRPGLCTHGSSPSPGGEWSTSSAGGVTLWCLSTSSATSSGTRKMTWQPATQT